MAHRQPGVVPTVVVIETGRKRTFASALDWPGWCRQGRGEADAIEALRLYAPRYAPVAEAAGFPLPAVAAESFDIVERLPGSATTDFGAPDRRATEEMEAVGETEAARLGALLRAIWTFFAEVVARTPAELRRGPRGGGRDRDEIVDHVVNAEIAYSRKLGIRGATEISSVRETILASLTRPPVEVWPHRYATRRIAWHVLDHAWEMEDRSRS